MAKFCTKCGAKLEDDYAVCPDCGARCMDNSKDSQPQQQTAQAQTNNTTANGAKSTPVGKKCNKWTSVLLCFFLGGYGAHKFYEGKMGMGILYLFTAGLLGIGVLVDLLTLVFKEGEEYYV